MIRRKDLEYLLGWMEGSMREIGGKENNMDLENIYYQMVQEKRVNGKMENV
jgi:hypothetical protein